MREFLDILLNSVCHREGASAGMALCLRCSCVYTGVFAGLIFEILRRIYGKVKGSAKVYWVAAGGLALMAVVGLGGLSDFWAIPGWLKVFAALYFGWAIAFFSVTAIAVELGMTKQKRTDGLLPRIGLLGIFVVCTILFELRVAWVLRILDVCGLAGLAAAFFAVNFALALVLLRGIKRLRARIALCLLLLFAFVAAEFALFFLWRRLL